MILVNNRDDLAAYETALGFAVATDKGISAARDVANEAPNVLTPSELAKKAKHLSKAYADKISVTVLGEKEMQKMGMGCFLAVSQGSDEEGKMAVIEYYGKTGKASKKLAYPTRLPWWARA